MSWLSSLGGSAIGSIVGGPVGAVAGLFGGGGGGNSIGGAGSVDPYSPYRGQATSMLAQLMQGQGLANNPAYNAEIGQAAEAVNRKSAAGGMFNSGNRLAGLTQAATDITDQTFEQQFSLLNQLSGNAAYNQETLAKLSGEQSNMQSQGLGELGQLAMMAVPFL